LKIGEDLMKLSSQYGGTFFETQYICMLQHIMHIYTDIPFFYICTCNGVFVSCVYSTHISLAFRHLQWN